jgi:hypothetical protein
VLLYGIKKKEREEDLNHRVPLIAHGQWKNQREREERDPFGALAVVASACLSFDKRLHSRSRPTIDALLPPPSFPSLYEQGKRKTFTIYSDDAERLCSTVHKHTHLLTIQWAHFYSCPTIKRIEKKTKRDKKKRGELLLGRKETIKDIFNDSRFDRIAPYRALNSITVGCIIYYYQPGQRRRSSSSVHEPNDYYCAHPIAAAVAVHC